MAIDMLTDASMPVNMSPVQVIQRIDQCCPVLEAPLRQDEAETLAGALRVLADPARLRLVSLIAASPEGETCVCNLTEPLELSQPTVSHHLKILHEAGVLDREQRGRWVYYRLRPGVLDGVAAAFAPKGG
jgi:ArsR family transcriptional regulator